MSRMSAPYPVPNQLPRNSDECVTNLCSVPAKYMPQKKQPCARVPYNLVWQTSAWQDRSKGKTADICVAMCGGAVLKERRDRSCCAYSIYRSGAAPKKHQSCSSPPQALPNLGDKFAHRAGLGQQEFSGPREIILQAGFRSQCKSSGSAFF